MQRKFFLTLGLLILMVSLGRSRIFALHNEERDFTLVFHGVVQTDFHELVFQRNTVMIPVKDFSQFMSVSMDENHFYWDKEESSLTIRKENRVIKIYNNRRFARINGEGLMLGDIPFIKKGLLYVSYEDLARLFDIKAVLDRKMKVLAFVDEKLFEQNKNILQKIITTLNMQERLEVEIKFDFHDELFQFDFKVDNLNKLVNGRLSVDKFYNNRHIMEKAEIYVKDNNSFVKDYKINKWRLEESGSFNVIRSFLSVFSSSHMLYFGDVALATFVLRETPRGLVFQNSVIFNEYLKDDLGFFEPINFNFRMNVDKNSYEIVNLVVQNSEILGEEVKNSRLDIAFLGYGRKVNLVVPKINDFVERYVDDIRNVNAIRKGLILFIYDAQESAFALFEKIENVDDLIKALQGVIQIEVNHQFINYGPYLPNLMGGAEPEAAPYKPKEVGQGGIRISIDMGLKTIDVRVSEQDELIIIK
jgi:hypothetical protein